MASRVYCIKSPTRGCDDIKVAVHQEQRRADCRCYFVTVAAVSYICSAEYTVIEKTRKMTAQCAPYVGALKFSGLPDYAHGYYSRHFSWAFVPIDRINILTKFEVRSFTLS